jgi:hypothetical protein
MNEEVRKAAECMDGCISTLPEGNKHDWKTIRAELTRLTEIADSVDPIVIRLHDVTAKLEAANALLRDIASFPWFVSRAPFTAERIDAHLHNSAREVGE